MGPTRTLLAASAAMLAFLVSSAPQAAHPEEPEASLADATTVGQAIALRRERVAEFGAIRQAAEELGLRVWLFGGTAAGYAHYVRSDLLREGGDARFRGSFFDYDFTNIYRSTQDADLVVDGTPEQATALENLIRQKMGFLQGSKDHWEVRLLRHPRATGSQVKLPLLDNPDFLEQNTDSNSTGMIELTDPPAGESVVRDLRDWQSPLPFFLQDVTGGRLHYYRSPTHERTSRFLSGDNPPLFSVIRFLVKAFQYDLTVDGEDRAQVQAIIDAFQPERDLAAMSPWARGWLERYGPNLIRHAVNVEYAWNELTALGLRQKLLSLSDPGQVGTLGWWLSKEPLRTRPVGAGNGPTARELGITVVAHETNEFLSYESITRDTTLRPNVLISRPNTPGESAALGEGFYTQLGRTGARGTGLTIRFTVDPEARDGSDFFLNGRFVVFTNRAALKVVPESLDVTWPQYFGMLREGLQADPNDRGIWMKLRRRLSIRPATPAEERELLAIVSAAIEEQGEAVPQPLLQEWFGRPYAAEHPEVLSDLLDLPRRDEPSHEALEVFLAREVLSRPEWAAHPELLRRLIGRSAKVNNQILASVFTQPAWVSHPELAEALIQDRRFNNGKAVGVLGAEPWTRHRGLLEALVEQARQDRLGSDNALRAGYREAAFNVTNDPEETEMGLKRVRIVQGPHDDGSFGYTEVPLYFTAPSWKSVPSSRATAVARMAGSYARALAPGMVGIPPSPDPRELEQARIIGEEFLVRGGALLAMNPPLTAADEATLKKATQEQNFPNPTRLSPALEALMEKHLRRMLQEAEAQARGRLQERWPAVEAVAKALLAREDDLSAEEFERLVREALSPGEWTGVIGDVEEAGQREAGEDCPGK